MKRFKEKVSPSQKRNVVERKKTADRDDSFLLRKTKKHARFTIQ